MVVATELKENISNSLHFTVFNKNQIEILLKKVSTNEIDYVKEYSNGKIKCQSCNEIIGPKSKNHKTLGTIIVEHDKIKFICNELNCYEKALREK